MPAAGKGVSDAKRKGVSRQELTDPRRPSFPSIVSPLSRYLALRFVGFIFAPLFFVPLCSLSPPFSSATMAIAIGFVSWGKSTAF
jgi:hypothetical protein